jgi:hypothetical protein
MRRDDKGRQLCDACKLPRSPLKQVDDPAKAGKRLLLCRACREAL